MLRRSIRLLIATIATFGISHTAEADPWVNLIGTAVSDNWIPKSPDHWTTGGSVLHSSDRPETLELTPGRGILFAKGMTKSRDANISSMRHFGDIRLEVEFMIPQGSNSGIYVMGRYELQIKDSYGKAKINSHDCGAIYQRWDDTRGKGQEGYEGHIPAANASKPPGEWQTFEIEFRAPRFDESGSKITNATFVSVKQNGTIIHENVRPSGPTRGAISEAEAATGPLMLQGNHGPIAFRKLNVLERTGK